MTEPPTTEPSELRDVALAIAADVVTFLAEQVHKQHEPDLKSSAADFVTEVDRASEQMISEALEHLRPGDGLLGEEGTERSSRTGVRWIVDPIDGTTNFVYGVPGFSVSIAAEHNGELVAGVVADVMHREIFDAFRGGGARMNGRSIAPRSTTNMESAVISTGFGFLPERRKHQAEVLVEIIPHIGNVRRFGSAAIDLCWVACGRVDGFWEEGLNMWDYAAGALIAAEAGAVVHGGPSPQVTSEMAVALAPGIAAEFSKLLASATP